MIPLVTGNGTQDHGGLSESHREKVANNEEIRSDLLLANEWRSAGVDEISRKI